MGCECNQKELLNDGNIVNINYFKLLYPIGKGGFGRVWKVQLKKNLLTTVHMPLLTSQ